MDIHAVVAGVDCDGIVVGDAVSPERAEEIFYEAYRAGLWRRVGEPVVQRELRMSCWRAVVESVERECCERVALEYLKGSDAND